MNKWIAAAAMTLAVPFASAKVLISIDGGAGYRTTGLSDDSQMLDGQYNLAGNSSSAPYGLGMEGQGGLYGWASLSLPLLPDVKVKYENMVVSGANNVVINQEVFGEVYNLNGNVTSTLDLSHLDMALTIGLPLPVVDIDLGLNARSMLGGFSAYLTSDGESQSVDAPFSISDKGTPLIIPMAYASAYATVPGVGVKVGGEISSLPLGKTNVTDWTVKGTWYAPLPTNMLVKFGLEGGYRSFNLTIGDTTFGQDTSSFASDIRVGGFFLGGTFHF